MTSPDDRRDLPPEQDAVRRLLAEVRHDEPVPPAVAARLDEVLEELSAGRRSGRERRPGREDAPVVDLAARRRHRVGTTVLAAAAVVVAGVGIGQVLGQSGSDSGAASSSAGAESDSGTGASALEESDAGEAGAAEPEGSDSTMLGRTKNDATPSAGAPEVSSGSLRRDLRAALASARAAGPGTLSDPGSACEPAEAALVGEGRQVAVTFDGRPALALYRVPLGAGRRVDVYRCGTDVPAESLTLRAR